MSTAQALRALGSACLATALLLGVLALVWHWWVEPEPVLDARSLDSDLPHRISGTTYLLVSLAGISLVNGWWLRRTSQQ